MNEPRRNSNRAEPAAAKKQLGDRNVEKPGREVYPGLPRKSSWWNMEIFQKSSVKWEDETEFSIVYLLQDDYPLVKFAMENHHNR